MMLRRKVVLITMLLITSILVQNSHTQNQPSPLNPTSWGVVYDVPATKQVTLRADVPYLCDERGTLTLALAARDRNERAVDAGFCQQAAAWI